jgi:hypothetical protein
MSQTQLTPSTPEADIQVIRETAAFELVQRQAKMLASSSLVPKEFQNNLPNCAIGLNIAKRLGADPFMVLQNVDIIHGRPSFRATFLIAMVNASGRFSPLQFKMSGSGQDRSCVAWARDIKTDDVIEGPEISMAMAKAEGWSTKSGSKWLTMPELMLRYRAAAFFARLYAPDITLGMQTSEELADISVRDVTNTPRTLNFDEPSTTPVEPPTVDLPVEPEQQPGDDAAATFSATMNEYDIAPADALAKLNKWFNPARAWKKLSDVPESNLREALNQVTDFIEQ